MSRLIDYLATLPQYILPQHFLSRIMLFITRVQFVPFKNFFIKTFIQMFNVDMSLAQKNRPEDFIHFNDFFTRSLRPEARPLDIGSNNILSPVDGAVSQIGKIDTESVFQAKGYSYSLTRLLGNHQSLASRFINGEFATIYLSPRDYHRIHMPVTGKLISMTHVPGKLFSVNTRTTRMVPELFARNERVICVFETEHGPMALVMVGAIFVGSMETVWSGTVTPSDNRSKIITWDYDKNSSEQTIVLQQGQEMGRFNMGSTVILLFPEHSLKWQDNFREGTCTRMGERLAEFQAKKYRT